MTITRKIATALFAATTLATPAIAAFSPKLDQKTAAVILKQNERKVIEFLAHGKGGQVLILKSSDCTAFELQVKGKKVWYTGTWKIVLDADVNREDHDENIFMGLAKNGISHEDATAELSKYYASYDAG